MVTWLLFAVFRPDALSCFEDIYHYTRSGYGEGHLVPHAVVGYIYLFSCLLPLIANCSAAWLTNIHMCAAAGSRLGVVASKTSLEDVRAAGSFREKWRRKNQDHSRPVRFREIANPSISH